MIGAWRVLAAGLLIVAAVPCVPRSARAHALVLEASPRANEVLGAPPSRIFLRFNSRIEQGLSSLTVTGPLGRPIPLLVAGAPEGAPDRLVVPLPPLQPDTYLVRWKVLSADGHVTEGAFRFTVSPGP